MWHGNFFWCILIVMRKKNKDLTRLSSGLKDLFIHKNLSTLWQTYTLGQQWALVAGKNIAKKSEPAYIQNDILWIYVESSVLMQHMQHQKLSLLEKINNVIPEAGIQDVRWAMQPAKPPGEAFRKVRREINRPDPDEKNAFEAMTTTLEDKKCRDALRRLWNTYYDD